MKIEAVDGKLQSAVAPVREAIADRSAKGSENAGAASGWRTLVSLDELMQKTVTSEVRAQSGC
jgi:hypothetical protein